MTQIFIRAFRHSYLAALLLITLSASAQNYTKNPGYFEWDGGRFKYGLQAPRRDTVHQTGKIDSIGTIVYRPQDSCLYVKSDTGWAKVGSGAVDLTPFLLKSDTAAMLDPYLRKIDTTGMLSGYVRTGYRHIDSLILKRAADSTIIDLQLPVVNPIWFGAVPNDGTSDRNAFQEAISYAAGRGIIVVPPGLWELDTSLIVITGTTIRCQEGATIKLMNGSDCAMVTNQTKTTPLSMTVVDSMITIEGGYWNGNGDNQVKFMPDGTPVVGFLFAGVKYLDFRPKKIYNTQTYAVFSANVSYSRYSDLEIDQGVYNPPLHNQDGLHFNGPSHHITVTNSVFKTFDDAVAFNTEDVPQGPFLSEGPITDILISNIVLNETRKGIRLLSADSLMDRVIVNNIVGTATDNLLEASAYGLGPGNFGDINVSNVNVKMQNNISNNEYISFNNRIRSVYVDNVIRKPDNNVRSTITIKPLADIDILQIRNVKTIADTTYSFSDIVTQAGAIVRRMIIDNYRFVGGRPTKSTAIAINSNTLQTLEIKNSSFDSLLTAISISNTSLKQLRLTDNSAYKLGNAVFLNASPIADTLHLYGSVMVDTLNNAFSTAGFASIGRIKTYLPTVSVPAATATFAPIKYTYSGTQYSLNPISTIDLQTVTNVSGLTTNMVKVTGANNVKNGNGVELFVSGGQATVWSFDRGGTNALQPLLVAGQPLNANGRIVMGTASTASDDGNTTVQVKGSFSTALASTGTNLTLTAAHHTVKLTATGLTITLPSAASGFADGHGRIYCIINPNAATSTISTYNALAGGTSTTIPANAALWLQSNGTTWDQIK